MSERIMRENLVTLAQVFASARGWSLATVSKHIHGNQAFLDKFLKGEVSPTLRTYFAMMEKLRNEWPPGVKRPKLARIPIWG
jgi:hypothetical protein